METAGQLAMRDCTHETDQLIINGEMDNGNGLALTERNMEESMIITNGVEDESEGSITSQEIDKVEQTSESSKENCEKMTHSSEDRNSELFITQDMNEFDQILENIEDSNHLVTHEIDETDQMCETMETVTNGNIAESSGILDTRRTKKMCKNKSKKCSDQIIITVSVDKADEEVILGDMDKQIYKTEKTAVKLLSDMDQKVYKTEKNSVKFSKNGHIGCKNGHVSNKRSCDKSNVPENLDKCDDKKDQVMGKKMHKYILALVSIAH